MGGKRAIVREYGILKNGEILERGRATELAKKMYTNVNNIYVCEKRKQKLDYQYDVVVLGQIKNEEVQKKMKQNPIDDYYIRHLKLYGNTVVRSKDEKNLKQLLEELKVKGYECEVKTYRYYGGAALIIDGSKLSKRGYRTDYVLKIKEV